MKIFVGNLSFESKEADVYQLFMPFGSLTYVSIVMDKNGKKSRGFGFIEMPDEQQAQAAIAALDGKEFMGRTLNISPAHSKFEPGQNRQDHRKEQGQKKTWFSPVFERTGRYKEGRRTRSFIMRRVALGEEPVVPVRKSHDNPMRWRKKQTQPKPWQKKQGESAVWGKTNGEHKPWQKRHGEPKPWSKPEGQSKPWKKADGKPAPRQKSNKQLPQSGVKGRKKSGGYKNRGGS